MPLPSRWLAITLATLVLAGCIHSSREQQVSVANGVRLALHLPTATFAMTQSVEASYRGQRHWLLVQVEGSPQRLVLAGLSATGARLFSVEFDGETVQSWHSPLFNAPVDGRYLLADVALSLFSLDELEPALSGPATLREYPQAGGHRRELLDLQAHPLIRIDYRDTTTRYCHLQREYCLKIDTLR